VRPLPRSLWYALRPDVHCVRTMPDSVVVRVVGRCVGLVAVQWGAVWWVGNCPRNEGVCVGGGTKVVWGYEYVVWETVCG